MSVLARELGVPATDFIKWRAEIKKHDVTAFPGKGKRGHNSAELTKLKSEIARLR